MSSKHPIIALTGSSGAGTSAVRQRLEALFVNKNITPAQIQGDSFHKYTRGEMQKLGDAWERTAGRGISHFGPETNLLSKLEQLFKEYSETGGGESRLYLHNEEIAAKHGQSSGTFTPWARLPNPTDLLFYEGLHGGIVTESVNVAQHVDLLIGVTPTINLEWIQKINRDSKIRGHSKESITGTILRRMDDYVHFITPQFSRTHINFQRVPTIDTSNPFSQTEIPSANESFIVINFARIAYRDYDYLLEEIPGSFKSRPDTLVVPGEYEEEAMSSVLEPQIISLVENNHQMSG